MTLLMTIFSQVVNHFVQHLHTYIHAQVHCMIVHACAYIYARTILFSRFYIGLAVGLPVFSNISLILTSVQTVLSLQGKATSRN